MRRKIDSEASCREGKQTRQVVGDRVWLSRP